MHKLILKYEEEQWNVPFTNHKLVMDMGA